MKRARKVWRRDVASAALAAAVALLLSACARPVPVEDERAPYAHLSGQPAALQHLPPFTRAPLRYGGLPAFSRAAVVAVALREWEMFGRQAVGFGDDSAEDAIHNEASQGYWQRIGEYWWLGVPADARYRRSTGAHDSDGLEAAGPGRRDAWSAAFISYVMRVAGARGRFPYSGAHRVYIAEAKRNRDAGRDALIIAHPPDAYAPQPGDLLCSVRGNALTISFDMLPDRLPPDLAGRWESHCDLVVGRDGDGVELVGGNLRNAVAWRRFPVDAAGRVACPPNGPDWCLAMTGRWLAVIEVRYRDAAGLPVARSGPGEG